MLAVEAVEPYNRRTQAMDARQAMNATKTMSAARKTGLGRLAMLAALAAGIGFGMQNSARAGDLALSVGVGVGAHVPVHAGVVTVTRPAVVQSTDQIWVPAEYAMQEVCEDVPTVTSSRQIPTYNNYGEITGYRTVSSAGHATQRLCRNERVLVREGYYRTVQRSTPVVQTSQVIGAYGGVPGYYPGFVGHGVYGVGVGYGPHAGVGVRVGGYGYGYNPGLSVGLNYNTHRGYGRSHRGRSIGRQIRRDVAHGVGHSIGRSISRGIRHGGARH